MRDDENDVAGGDADATKPLPKAESGSPAGEPGTEVYGLPDEGGAREIGTPGANPVDDAAETTRLEAINTGSGGHNAPLSGGATAPVASHVPIATASAATGGAGGLPPTPRDGNEGGRSPWPWIIGAIVVIALAAIGVAFATANGGGGDDTEPSTTPKTRPSITMTPSPSEVPETREPSDSPSETPSEAPTEAPETPAPVVPPAPTTPAEPAPSTPVVPSATATPVPVTPTVPASPTP